MKNTIVCPKCGNEMEYGEIGMDPFYARGVPLLFWAPKKVFDRMFPNCVTAKKKKKEGGMSIRLGNGMINDRTTGYACKSCRCVLLDL